MPFQLISPLYETFELTEIDKAYENDGEPTTVTIRQASQGQHAERQKLFAKLERKFSELEPDEITVVSSVSTEDLRMTEVYLTLVDSNIENIEGEPLFTSKTNKDGNPYLNMTRQAFINAWGKLPPDVCRAIHERVLKVNAMWGGDLGEDS